MGRPSEPGSLRSSGGISYLGLDRQTKISLKQLAGDVPVSHYVRALVQRELERATGKGKALPSVVLVDKTEVQLAQMTVLNGALLSWAVCGGTQQELPALVQAMAPAEFREQLLSHIESLRERMKVPKAKAARLYPSEATT